MYVYTCKVSLFTLIRCIKVRNKVRNMSSNRWYFAVEGDIHGHVDEGQYKIHDYKMNPDKRFNNISSKYPIDFVLCIGDLTNHGYDGTTGNIFEGCIPNTWSGDRSHNELAAFRTLYEKPLENAGFKLYLCIGNHDLPPGHKGVAEYVQKKHKTRWPLLDSKWRGGQYKFKHNGVTFLCLGVYPNVLSWLEKNLPSKGEPVIIWYHYNTVIGEQWSDFWSVEDKFKFANVIEGHNILAICNGHSHSTVVGMFNDHITVRGSYKNAAILEIQTNDQGTTLNRVFFDTGVDDQITEVDRLAKFHQSRRRQTSKQKKYDADNRNTPSPDPIAARSSRRSKPKEASKKSKKQEPEQTKETSKEKIVLKIGEIKAQQSPRSRHTRRVSVDHNTEIVKSPRVRIIPPSESSVSCSSESVLSITESSFSASSSTSSSSS